MSVRLAPSVRLPPFVRRDKSSASLWRRNFRSSSMSPMSKPLVDEPEGIPLAPTSSVELTSYIPFKL